MNILIPMAGRGSRFQAAGYTFPKPLIEVTDGKPMIQVVVENIGMEARYIFLALGEHCDKYALHYLMPLICDPNPCQIVRVDEVTQGAACTVLLARDLIDNDDELVIANSDQWMDWDPEHFLAFIRNRDADGGILTFHSTHPKWSFARIDDLSERITEVAEKKPISNAATVGVYYFKRGRDFIEAANRMIAKDIRTNGEFYICPVFNELIEDGKKILPYWVPQMRGLGTPEDLDRFIKEGHKV